MEPLVSILMPAHNAERWIAETLECAVGQTWVDKEIIVVDDGSTDSTCAVARRFERHGVKVFTQARAGACAARNRALRVSRGQLIQWLDADDVLAADKIERQVRSFLSCGDDRVVYTCSWGRFYYCVERARIRHSVLWEDASALDWLLLRFGHCVYMPIHSFLISRSLAEMAGPWDERLRRDQDGEYVCRVVAASRFVKFVSDAWCYYRDTGRGSTSHNASVEAFQSVVLAVKLCAERLLQLEDSPRIRMAAAKYCIMNAEMLARDAPDLGEHLREIARELAPGSECALSGRPRMRWLRWAWHCVPWRVRRRFFVAAEHGPRLVDWCLWKAGCLARCRSSGDDSAPS